MTILSPVERLFCLANVLHTNSALEKVYGVFGFASQIAKSSVFLSSAVAFKSLGVQYLSTYMYLYMVDTGPLYFVRADMKFLLLPGDLLDS